MINKGERGGQDERKKGERETYFASKIVASCRSCFRDWV